MQIRTVPYYMITGTSSLPELTALYPRKSQYITGADLSGASVTDEQMTDLKADEATMTGVIVVDSRGIIIETIQGE